MASKIRADVALTQQGLAPSREKAQALIMAGQVFEGTLKIAKASQPVTGLLTVKGHDHPYVSRGALKLEKALKEFSINVQGITAMDIGASTGGFTDVLLQAGAAHVYAVDVGYGQLDWKIRSDSRVTVLERTNARYLTRSEIPEVPALTVMDVSFISVKLILPVTAALMEQKGLFAILIKPQFEAGRENIGKKGVVRDPAVHETVVRDIRDFCPEFGYQMTGCSFSPITGPEGNIEYIARLVPKENGETPVQDEEIHRVVEASHQALAKKPSAEE